MDIQTNTPAAPSSCTDPESKTTLITGELGDHSIQQVEHQASPTIASKLSEALYEFLENLQPHPPTPIPTPESTPESTPPPSPQRSRTNSLNCLNGDETTSESSPSSPTKVEPSEDGVALSPSLSVASLGDGEDDDNELDEVDSCWIEVGTPVNTPQRSRANSLDSADTSSPLNKLETFITEQQLTTEDADTLRQGAIVSHVTFNDQDCSAQFTFHQLIETDPASLAAAVFNPANGKHFIPRCDTVDKIESNDNTTSAEYKIKGPKMLTIRMSPYILNLKNELTPLENQDGYKVVSTLQQQPGSKSSLLENFTTSLEVQDGSISALASKSLVTYKGNLQLQSTVGFVVKTALGENINKALKSKLTEVFTKQTALAQLPVTSENSSLFNTAIQAMDKGSLRLEHVQ
jgi:hypothetical protein